MPGMGAMGGSGFGIGPSSPAIEDMIASRANSAAVDRFDASQSLMAGGSNIPMQSVRPRRPKSLRPEDEDINPVKMVRPANPYADIPSLYDMYLQASPVQKPAGRFGLEVFRNSVSRPGFIPMDLPVGPDYVVGPGDSLSIDLWGGYSQRFVRIVDRTGRVSLPEAGPLLVSGKSLGEVQLEVQRVLRSQFRDVSADVSVSRLSMIRV